MFWAVGFIICLAISKVELVPVRNSNDLAIAIETGHIIGPHNLHPKLPIAVESVPAHHGQKMNTFDCPGVDDCDRTAWSDLGLGLAGLVPKDDLCRKYKPATSCVSKALSQCIDYLDSIEKKNLLSFARIMVSWCSRLEEKNTSEGSPESAECDSMALFNSITAHGCLSDVVHPHRANANQGVISSAQDQDSNQGLDLQELVNSFLKNYYDTSTVSCLYSAMEDACGTEAARLSLGSAVDNNSTSQRKKNKSENSSLSSQNEASAAATVESPNTRSSSPVQSFSFSCWSAVVLALCLALFSRTAVFCG